VSILAKRQISSDFCIKLITQELEVSSQTTECYVQYISSFTILLQQSPSVQ
jgi:hypothetical protein